MGAVYMLAVRPWHRRWGATNEEVAQVMPGDDLLSDPVFRTTRAITIHARPDQIWPWLVQMGQGRGGMYSYDALENLTGLDMRTADRILPQWQDLKVGDVIPLEPGGSGYTVDEIDPAHVLVLYTDGDQETETGRLFRAWNLVSTWVFMLDPVTAVAGDTDDGAQTRLIVRWQARMDLLPRRLNGVGLFGLLIGLTIEPIEFLMEQKMLRTIKQRVELSLG
jgi:hypothetical protein